MKAETLSYDLLRKIPVFRGMSKVELDRLADIATTTAFAPGDIVLKQGAQSRRLWIVLHGKCEVFKTFGSAKTKREPIVLATLDPYHNFGEMSFFHPAPHSANVRAKTAVRLLSIERSAFDDLVENQGPAACKLVINVIDSLAERLRRMDDWVAELIHQNEGNSRVPELNQLRATLFDTWTL